MAVAGLDRDTWAREKTAFAAEILAGLRDSGHLDREEFTPPESMSLLSPDAEGPSAFPRSNSHRGPRRWKRPLVLAASLLLAFALPVLAIVGVHHLRSTPATPEPRAETWEEGAATATSAQPAGPKGDDALPGTTADANAGFPDAAPAINETLDSVAEAAFRDFELATLLPDTEEEYEAWARKEYPHIMALYDILIVPEGGESGAATLWDGDPVHVPPWADRLYRAVPDAGRPRGWRALVIYSGAAIEFDWPATVDAPNYRPALEGLHNAAGVAGFSLELGRNGTYPVPRVYAEGDTRAESRFSLGPLRARPEWRTAPAQDTPEAYAKLLASDAELGESVLVYIAVSGGLFGTAPFDGLSQIAANGLKTMLETPVPECDKSARISVFGNVLDSRWELLNEYVPETIERPGTAVPAFQERKKP